MYCFIVFSVCCCCFLYFLLLSQVVWKGQKYEKSRKVTTFFLYMQARANFFARKIIVTLRKGLQSLFHIGVLKSASSFDFIGDF